MFLLNRVFLGDNDNHLCDWIDSLPWGVEPRSDAGPCRINVPPVSQSIAGLLQSLAPAFAAAGRVVNSEPFLGLSYDLRLMYRNYCGRILTVSSSDESHLELAYIYFVCTGQIYQDLCEDAYILSPVRRHNGFCLGGYGVDYGPQRAEEGVRCVPIMRVDFVRHFYSSDFPIYSCVVRQRTLLIFDHPDVGEME